MNNWMSDLDDDKTLTKIVMPGSHDATIFVDSTEAENHKVVQITTMFASEETTVCQDRSIYKQCVAGSRFFDIRLKMYDGLVRGYHTPKDWSNKGAFGAEAESILDDVDTFLTENTREFVILRISHTSMNSGIVGIISGHPIFGKVYKNDYAQNIVTLPIKDLRGKVICIFDKKEFSTVLNPSRGILSFSKFDKKNIITKGIVTCGEYSNESAIRNVIAKQLERTNEHKDHEKMFHMFVFYWTQTGGNIEEHTKKLMKIKAQASGGTHDNTDRICSTLKYNHSQHFPSVIMYDFVNSETSEKIVNLNSFP